MSSCVIESHYLPCLEYFCLIQTFDKVILEHHEHYVKQSFRNRCYIKTSQGIEMLVVPLTGKHGKVAFKEVRIDTGSRWRLNHWRTITSAYARSPFFEHYSDDLYKALFTNIKFLCDLNQNLLSLCLRGLHLQKDIAVTVAYEKAPDNIFDLRSVIKTKESFAIRTFYRPQPYQQVFGNAFAANLSLIDLLFCEGPRAGTFLTSPGKKELNK